MQLKDCDEINRNWISAVQSRFGTRPYLFIWFQDCLRWWKVYRLRGYLRHSRGCQEIRAQIQTRKSNILTDVMLHLLLLEFFLWLFRMVWQRSVKALASKSRRRRIAARKFGAWVAALPDIKRRRLSRLKCLLCDLSCC